MFENLYLIFVVIFSGLGTKFYRSQEGIFVLFLIAIILYFKNKFKISREFWIIIIIWNFYVLLQTIIFKEFHPYFSFIMPANIFIAYFMFKKFGMTILNKYEVIIYYLSIISLFFYIYQLVDPASLKILMDTFDISGYSGKHTSNVVVYSVHFFSYTRNVQNCGFCWEPGPYSCYLAIAIFFNVIRNNFNVINDKKFWIMSIALFTTFSSTGILAYFLIIVFLIYQHKKSKLILFAIIPTALMLLVYLYFSLPFLNDKIMNEYDGIKSLQSTISKATYYRSSYALGRFASFYVSWKDFINNPLLGYGGHTKAQWLREINLDIATINGISNIMAKYGLFGLLTLLYLVFNLGKLLTALYKKKITIWFILLIFILSFGFGVVEYTIMISILFSAVFYKEDLLVLS